MTHYQRLLECSEDELELALLRSADGDSPRPEWLDEAKGVLGVAGVAGVAGSGAAGAALSGQVAAGGKLGGAALGATATTGLQVGATKLAVGGLLKAVLTGVIGGVVAVVGLRAVTSGLAADEPRFSDTERGVVATQPLSVAEDRRRATDTAERANEAQSPSQERATSASVREASGSKEAPSNEAERGVRDGDALGLKLPVLEQVPTRSFPREATGPSGLAGGGETGRLAQEVAILQRARGALLSGDAGGALSILAEYNRVPRSHVLATEASLLQIQAHLKQGDRVTAKRLARRFTESHPESHHAAALRDLVREP